MARFDTHIQIIPEADYTGLKFYSFAYARSQKVSGIQKLVNLFAKCLLTPLGSDPLDLSYGTELTRLIGSNITPRDASEVLLLAVEAAAKTIQAAQTGRDVPSSERLQSAVVTQLIIIEDSQGFAAQIYIKNVANQQLTFLLPTLEVRT